MTPRAYYNDNDPAAAHCLRTLIADGVIAPGDVDDRSIKDVQPDDLRGYAQAHFFAGGGLWSVAARLAGWPDARPIWTGSCPCQPFSVAGKGAGHNDVRHLWPDFFRLICACRPSLVVGEQVAGARGYGWFDGISADLENDDYACRAVDIPALAVDAPHIRQRLYWVAVANADSGRREPGDGTVASLGQGRSAYASSGRSYSLADASGGGRDGRTQEPIGREEQRAAVERAGGGDMADSQGLGRREEYSPAFNGARQASSVAVRTSFWRGAEWRIGADGKARRVGSSLCRMAYGRPARMDDLSGGRDEVLQTIPLLTTNTVGRVGQLRILGNAIVAPLAVHVLASMLECGL